MTASPEMLAKLKAAVLEVRPGRSQSFLATELRENRKAFPPARP